MKKHLLFIVLIVIATNFYAQDSISLSNEELKLYQILNEYRQENSLPVIPLSASLTYVAQSHVKDLQDNNPNTGDCNMHSWSDKGRWSACCYTPDHAQASCMWNKPKELTPYTGNGYENSYMSSGSANADGALSAWKNSSAHNDVILNNGMWESHPWKSIGIGIYKNYAVLWFGDNNDPVANYTTAGALAAIQGYATQNDASNLTILELNVAGVTGLDNAKIDEYKQAVSNASAISDTNDLKTIIETAQNNSIENNKIEDIIIFNTNEKLIFKLNTISINSKFIEADIYNALGQKVAQKKLNIQPQMEMDIAKLKAGIYFVSVQFQGRLLQKKIILK